MDKTVKLMGCISSEIEISELQTSDTECFRNGKDTTANVSLRHCVDYVRLGKAYFLMVRNCLAEYP